MGMAGAAVNKRRKRFWLALAVLLLPVALYAAIPYAAEHGVRLWLQQQGFSQVVFDMERPAWNRLHIRAFSAVRATPLQTTEVSSRLITLHFSPLRLFLAGEVDRLTLPDTVVTLTVDTPQEDTSEPGAGIELSRLLPATWFALIPAQEVLVGRMHFTLDYPGTVRDWQVDAGLTFNRDTLASRAHFTRGGIALGYADLQIDSANRLHLSVLRNDRTAARFEGTLAAEAQRLIFDFNQSADMTALAGWLGDLGLASPSLSELTGDIAVNGRASLPTGVLVAPEKLIDEVLLELSYSLDARSAVAVPPLTGVSARITGTAVLQAGALELEMATGSEARAALEVAGSGNGKGEGAGKEGDGNKEEGKHRGDKGRVQARLTDSVRLSLPVRSASLAALRVTPLQLQIALPAMHFPPFSATAQMLRLSVDSYDPAQHRTEGQARTELNGVSIAGRALPPLRIESRFKLDHQRLVMDMAATNDPLALRLKLNGSYDLARQEANLRWTLKPLALNTLATLLRPHLGKKMDALTVHRGMLFHNGEAVLNAGGVAVSAWNAARDLVLQWDKTLFEGVQWESATTLAQSGRLSDAGRLNVARVESGVALTDLTTDYRLQSDTKRPDSEAWLKLGESRAALLGGEVRLAALDTSLQRPQFESGLRIRQIALDALLKLEQQPGLSGSGTLSGAIPLRVDEAGVSVSGGHIAADGAGYIRFQPDSTVAAYAAANQGLAMALGALENFNYDLLEVGVDYQTDGTAHLKTRLKGHNPDWNRGHPVDFTINIEENIPDLIRTLQFADRLTEKLEQRYGR